MEFLDDDFTVLLYYQYCLIEDPQAILKWQQQVCEDLNLKGRIRISPEGLNGTLGGTQAEVDAYIRSFDLYPELLPSTIHWKVSKATSRYSLEEQRFQSLSCKVTKEVVSLDLPPDLRERMIAAGPGRHLTPQQFHDVIASAVARADSDKHRESHHKVDDGVMKGEFHEQHQQVQSAPEGAGGKQLVVIDVRNIYETEIGRFQCPASVPVLDPRTRKFKDFKDFVEARKEELRDKQVLMYCTGGVRCERASAFLRLHGVSDVSQLSGGIHAYQEAFPRAESFFQGKNFVYDPRIAVPHRLGSEGAGRGGVVGRCRLCAAEYDDYKAQVRCGCCRMLVLVCAQCRGEQEQEQEQEQGGEERDLAVICELCEDKGRGVARGSSSHDSK